jgi:serine acetyltransferase
VKTEPFDYLLSAIVMTLLVTIAGGGAALASWSFTRRMLGAYHVLADALMFLLIFGLAAAACCRLLVAAGMLRPGTYPMGDPLFRWWKLFTVVYEFGRGALLPFTSVFARPLVAKLFGAQIGHDIALGGHLVDPQFIAIGDGAIVGQDAVITAHTITSGQLVLDPVRVGARATVGVKVVVMSGVWIGDGAVIAAGAVVPPGTQIPPGELWGGIPARKLKDVAEN